MPRFFFLVTNVSELLAVEAFIHPYCSDDRPGTRGEGTLFWLDCYLSNSDKHHFPIAIGYDADDPLVPSWQQSFPKSWHTDLSSFLEYYQSKYGELYPIDVATHPADYPEYFL